MHGDTGMFELNPLSHQFWNEIALSLLCGVIVGIEREIRGKPVGLRTCILIVLSTGMFVRLGIVLAGTENDPTRVLGQVVTGVGFLGAGVIIMRGQTLTGVTTASVVWTLAAIGSLIGAGQGTAAISMAIVVCAVLLGLDRFERWMERFQRKED